jgi:hypothetical protein
MEDRALHNGRVALLAVLRAYLQQKRETQYVRGVLNETIAEAKAIGFKYRYFRRPS